MGKKLDRFSDNIGSVHLLWHCKVWFLDLVFPCGHAENISLEWCGTNYLRNPCYGVLAYLVNFALLNCANVNQHYHYGNIFQIFFLIRHYLYVLILAVIFLSLPILYWPYYCCIIQLPNHNKDFQIVLTNRIVEVYCM